MNKKDNKSKIIINDHGQTQKINFDDRMFINNEVNKLKREYEELKIYVQDLRTKANDFENDIEKKEALHKDLIKLNSSVEALKKIEDNYNISISNKMDEKRALIAEIKIEHEKLNEEKRKLDSLKDDLSFQINNAQGKLENIKNELRHDEEDLNQKKEEIAKFKDSHDFWCENEKKIRLEIDDLKFLKTKAEKELFETREKIDQDNAILEEYDKLKDELNSFKKFIASSHEEIDNLKMTRKLEEENINHLGTKKVNAAQELEKLLTKINYYENNIKEQENKQIELDSIYENTQKRHNDILINLRNAELEILHINNLKNDKNKEIKNSINEIEALLKTKDVMLTEINNINTLKEERAREIERLNGNKKDMEIELIRFKNLLQEKSKELDFVKNLIKNEMFHVDELKNQTLKLEKLISEEETKLEGLRNFKKSKEKEMIEISSDLENRRKELKTQTAKVQEIEMILDELENTKTKLLNETIRLEEIKARSEAQVRDKQSEIDDLIEKVKIETHKLDQIKEQHKQEIININALSNEKDTLIKENKMISQESAKIKSEISDIKIKINIENANLINIIQEQEKENIKHENIKKDISIKLLEKEALINEIDSKKIDLNILKNESEKYLEEINSYKLKCVEYRNIIKELEGEIVISKKNLSYIEKQIETEKLEENNLKDIVSKLLQEKDFYSKKISDFNDKISAMRNELISWNNKIVEKEIVYKKNEEELNKISNIIRERTSELMNIQDEIHKFEKDRQIITQRLDVASKHLQVLEDHKIHLMKQVEKYKKFLSENDAERYINRIKRLHDIKEITSDKESLGEDQIKKAS